jgi:peptidoglycan hydrolase-like protein with peptidoglycan-binding domain
MTKSIRTLAATAALVALTLGPALAAQAPKNAATTTTAKIETKSAVKAKPMRHAAWTKDQIKEAQEGLAKGGYYKGQPTGVWNKATAAALRAWQKANRMPATGRLSDETLEKLKAA